MGCFVTFEGGEGCGKTTQVRLAAQWLAGQGVPVVTTAEPGGTPLGIKIREILLNRSIWAIDAEAELLLFAAARAQHVRETILPALGRGAWVLCDRFADATAAYQGFGRGIDTATVAAVNAFSTLGRGPDLTILLDLPVEAGLTRARSRAAGLRPEKAEDRFEQEGLAFHERIRKGYLALAAGEPDRFRIIDGMADIAAVSRAVSACLASLLIAHAERPAGRPS
jgi:dTMP kinase